MKHKKKKHSSARIITMVILTLLILLIVVYNPISVRLMTVGVAIYYGIDPVIFYRLIKTESSFRTFAISPAQAIGLGQILEPTAFYIQEKHKRGMLFVPFYNLKLSAKYLLYLGERYNSNWSLMLAAYNWGETKVSTRMAGKKIEPEKDYRNRFRDIPETYNYINKILPPKNKA
ncbi:MAG: transglycosylase SLT domain-containing protein [Candidatus Cloacimonetes bacterium]|nr:transglycosylase SLT domain-containing protein [Candidatus Cloacimonadota bacterium]